MDHPFEYTSVGYTGQVSANTAVVCITYGACMKLSNYETPEAEASRSETEINVDLMTVTDY